MSNVISFEEILKKRGTNYSCELDIHNEVQNKIVNDTKEKDFDRELNLDKKDSTIKDVSDCENQQSYKHENFEKGLVLRGETSFSMLDEKGKVYYGPNSKNLNDTLFKNMNPVFDKVSDIPTFKDTKKFITLKSKYSSVCAIALIGIAISVGGSKYLKTEKFEKSPVGVIASNMKSSVSEDVSKSFLAGISEEVINPYNTFKVIKECMEGDIVYNYIVEIALYEDSWSIEEKSDKLKITFYEDKMDVSIGSVYPSEESLKNNNREELEERAKTVIRPKLVEKGVSISSVEKILKEQLPSLDLFSSTNLPVNVELVEGGN